jgi:hypothetical protein
MDKDYIGILYADEKVGTKTSSVVIERGEGVKLYDTEEDATTTASQACGLIFAAIADRK